MINRDHVVSATEAYIIAYDTAMNRTHDTNYAIQVASVVTMIVYQQEQINSQKQPPSIEAIVLAAMMQLEEAHRGEEPEEVIDDD